MQNRYKLLDAAVLAAALLVGSPSAQAAGTAVVKAKLASVHLESGIPFLTFDQTIGNPDNCASNAVVTLPSDLSNFDGYLSLVMTAMAAGKPVTVWIDGCAWSPWYPTVPRIYAMKMEP